MKLYQAKHNRVIKSIEARNGFAGPETMRKIMARIPQSLDVLTASQIADICIVINKTYSDAVSGL